MKKGGISAFQKKVYTHYSQHSRDLPWRHTKSPYHIFVSEVMLQQTQVDRVIPTYRLFLKTFPTLRLLADSSLADVLRVWQGLGYNRRGKFLHKAAKMIVRNYNGRFPKMPALIEQLPGVGHYTARAIVTFAYNQPEIFIETNIRTVYLHHFFKNKMGVADTDILQYVEDTLDREHSRRWYWALMDYGAWLKKEYGNANHHSAHYTKQSKFEGSNRQIRGLIIKTVLTEGIISVATLAKKIKRPLCMVRTVADTLVREGMVKQVGKRYIC